MENGELSMLSELTGSLSTSVLLLFSTKTMATLPSDTRWRPFSRNEKFSPKFSSVEADLRQPSDTTNVLSASFSIALTNFVLFHLIHKVRTKKCQNLNLICTELYKAKHKSTYSTMLNQHIYR